MGKLTERIDRYWTTCDLYRLFFGRWSQIFGLVVVAGAVASLLSAPVDRLPGPVCYVRYLTGLPCPGCGLTRSVCATAHGDVLDALRQNPFGAVVLPLAALMASSLLWPRRWQTAVRAWIDRHRTGVGRGYTLAVAAFVTFGVTRFLVYGILKVIVACSGG